jgi:hypothetical protein
MSGTAWRSLLAAAVTARLSATHPTVPVHRSRRAEVGEHERPCIAVMLGDAEMDESMAVGEVLITLSLTVMAFPAAATTDAGAEDALAAIEASIVAALAGEALTAPGGADLTMGLFVDASAVSIYPAEQSAARLGDVALTLRAQALLPRGKLTL